MQKVQIPDSSFTDLVCKCGSYLWIQNYKIKTYKGVLSAGQLITAAEPVFVCTCCGTVYNPNEPLNDKHHEIYKG